jgi:hypothetical protein
MFEVPGFHTKLLVMGFQPMLPLTAPVYVWEPAVGAVWLTWRVKVMPENADETGFVVQPAQVRLNEPRSTFVGARYVFDPAFTNVSENGGIVHTFATQDAPANVPTVENVTVCAAAGIAPRATAAVPTSTARANPRTPMFPPSMRGSGINFELSPSAQPLFVRRYFTRPCSQHAPYHSTGPNASVTTPAKSNT